MILSGPSAFLIFRFVRRFVTSHGHGRWWETESESGGTACVGPEWPEALVVFFLSSLL